MSEKEWVVLACMFVALWLGARFGTKFVETRFRRTSRPDRASLYDLTFYSVSLAIALAPMYMPLDQGFLTSVGFFTAGFVIGPLLAQALWGQRVQ